jgi:hypothetical protein
MKINKDNVKKLEEAFAIGADIRAACAYADISRQCYYNWIEADPKLQEKFDTLREKPILKAYNTIMKDLDKPDTAKWLLERKRKKEFSTRTELTGEDGKDFPSPILANVILDNDSNKKGSQDERKA